MLQRGCDLGLIEGINISYEGFFPSHLQFVDDKFIFSSTSLYSMQNIKRILPCFELVVVTHFWTPHDGDVVYLF
jgi:hypothetical protein